MKHVIILSLILLMSVTKVCADTPSTTLELEFVMKLRVTLGSVFTLGETPKGRRTVIPITGGTFEGPLLKGTILSGGADYQMATLDGKHTSLEAIYTIKTDDGYYIHVRNRGIISNRQEPYFRAAPQFEAPEDSPYAWLNEAIFVCAPEFSELFKGIVLNVWKVK